MKRLLIFILILAVCPLYASETLCVAHRSNGFGGLENSLEAMTNAVHQDASAVEFDIQHTKDGETIIYHDAKLDRLLIGENCPKGKLPSELTFKELTESCTLINGEKIPRLQDVLLMFKDSKTVLFVEFKDNSVSINDLALIKQIFKNKMSQIVFISFHRSPLKKVEALKKTDPELEHATTLQLKKYGHVYFPKDLGGMDAKFINRMSVWALHKLNKKVAVYTKDSAQEIKKYTEIGVDYITTNEPALCESLL